MVTAQAVIHGDAKRLIGCDPKESPVCLQLGGSDPAALARAASLGESFGYDEINLNCGCPSSRVQSGRFGACLMAEPELVARCFAAMQDAVAVPVTVKCRIAIDDQDETVALDRFVADVARAGCRTFILHARKAWLQGLSPKQNRDVPPLDYARVYRLKADWPELEIIVNGGIGDLDEAEVHLERVDGVMLGRAAYQDPWILADIDRRLFGAPNPIGSRWQAIEAYLTYVEGELGRGVPLAAMTRHVLGLFNGLPGARAFRRHLAETAHRPDAGPEVVRRAVQYVTERSLAEAA
jgi:tRNA-dihydrouridine synthase A